MTTVISGPGQPHIGKKLAELLKAKHLEVQHKFFPDGERDMILSGEECDEKTFIVHSITKPQDTNLISLIQLVYTANEFGAKEITIITPYLAYSAKDRRILKGEVVSIFNIFKMIQATPAKRHFIIDIHNLDVLKGKEKFFKNLTAMPAFGDYYRKKNLIEPLVLAPDFGAKDRVAIIGKVLNAPVDFFEKKRDPASGKTTLIPHQLNVKNRDVIIADEIIRTGGTIIKSINALHEMNVHDVFVASTHLMLVDNADKLIFDAGAKELIGTDSLPSAYSKIPVAPILYEALRN